MSGGGFHRRSISVGDANRQIKTISEIRGPTASAEPSFSVANEDIFDACRNGDVARVRKLLDSGVGVNSRDTSGRKSTPLHFAAGYGRREVVSLLLDHHADVGARDDGGLIPLHNACSFGHVEVVHLMLSAGSDPNARDCWNYTPLHEAAIKGKVEVCILLLQAKADPQARNLDGKTPVELAEGSARLALLGDYRKDELLEAARSGNEEKLVSLLTPQNVNCHASDGRKSTPLHLAAGYNRTKIVKILLANGADVVAKDKGGLIPLHNACSYGHLDVCELLISAGPVFAQIHAADLWQYTPLHEAASKSRAEVCSLLLAYGADPTKPNCHGKSALDLVPNVELRQRLAFEYRGHNLLAACCSGDLALVQHVLSQFIPPVAVGSTGQNPSCTRDPQGEHGSNDHKLITSDSCYVPTESTGAVSFDRNDSVGDLISRDLLRFRHPFNANTPLHAACSMPDTLFASNKGCIVSPPESSRKDSPLILEKDSPVLNYPKQARDMRNFQRQVLVEWLVEQGVGVDDRNVEHQTPLHFSARGGYLEVCACLLRHGAQPNVVDIHGLTPLHLAAKLGHTQLVRLLSEANLTTLPMNRQPVAMVTSETKPPMPLSSSYGLPTVGSDRDTRSCFVDSSSSSESSTAASFVTEIVECPLSVGDNDNKTCFPTSVGAVLPNQVAVSTDDSKRAYHDNSSSKQVASSPQVTYSNGATSRTSECHSRTPYNGPETTVNGSPTPLPFNPPSYSWADTVLQFLEAAKSGDVERVRRLILSHQHQSTFHPGCVNPTVNSERADEYLPTLSPPMDLINCRDIDGRHSTPLHFAAGYNRLAVVELLLHFNADVHAKDKGGLVPLHNACSYGHAKVAEMLIQHGANVNVTDLWRFTPLHEAAAKGKFEVCRLLLRNGADPNRKNRDGHTPLDLVRDTGSDVYDLLRGDIAVLEAAKRGNLSKLQKLLTPENINCRDTQGRNSAPLHLAAGYNNVDVVEYLLESGADVNAKDKGGLIPLHNASSYGHIDVAALLIRYGTSVNAVDKWGYTPLHEAAQKGRTQLCALLLAHGADPMIHNQENQIPLDLASADDVKSLLLDAMLHTNSSITTVTKDCINNMMKAAHAGALENPTHPPSILPSSHKECSCSGPPTATLSGPRVQCQGQEAANENRIIPQNNLSSNVNNLAQPSCSAPQTRSTGQFSSHPVSSPMTLDTKDILNNLRSLTTTSFLKSLDLGMYTELFEKEEITMDILAEMGHTELKELGVSVYGHRHRIIKRMQQWRAALSPVISPPCVDSAPSGVSSSELRSSAISCTPALNPGSLVLAAASSSTLSVGVTNPSGLPVLSTNPNASHFHGVGVSEVTPPCPMYFPPGSARNTVMVEIEPSDPEFKAVEEQMQSTIRDHKDNCGGVYKRYRILKVARIRNRRLWDRYVYRCAAISEDNNGHCNERLLFHGSPFLQAIVMKGFDERHAYIGGMFGAGIYFAENSSKSNQYVYGIGGGVGCPTHKSRSCYICPRQLLLCRVALGRSFIQFNAMKVAHAPPGHHSIVGRPSAGGLNFAEYVIYRGEQAYPEYLITYLLVPPDSPDHQSSAILQPPAALKIAAGNVAPAVIIPPIDASQSADIAPPSSISPPVSNSLPLSSLGSQNPTLQNKPTVPKNTSTSCASSESGRPSFPAPESLTPSVIPAAPGGPSSHPI
ncbi:unnamed protein product [Calicophoron daubneyi]|uniref:Poly [ADP-ribose] polymerase n=1 Tax=Calicophoron daubneyi TaxID=300641 RepID=A0AAV2T9D1_CALDB